MRRVLLAAASVLGLLVGPAVGVARADEPPPAAPAKAASAPAPKLIVVWPTFTPAGDEASATPLHRPTSLEEPLATRAHELDATLRDATQDLGFVLNLDDAGPTPGHARDLDMIARAGRARPDAPSDVGTWVVSARLEALGSDSFLLRVVAVPPNGRELRTRVEVVKGANVSVRGLVLVRDLLSPEVSAKAESADRSHVDAAPGAALTKPTRSAGRAVLAANGALFGGYVGYSVVRSTGSNDPRVLYPLLTLGTVVGLGGALLTAEEWDIGTGDAWYLSAGAWWGAGSGLLLARGTNSQPVEGPYAWGIGGGLAGLGLGTFALTRKPVDEGDALLTHSGAALGMWVGSLIELGYRGTTSVTPSLGAGLGSAIGLVGAGTTACFVTVTPSRVLLLDLGAGVGALAGAAAGSPLIFSDLTGSNTTPPKTRWFLAATLAGTAAGGTVAWFLTRDAAPRKDAWLNGMPNAGVIAESQTATGRVPVYGVEYSGRF